MSKETNLLRDRNGAPMPLMNLSSPHDVDGTSASAQSDAIDGSVVRICAIDDIRFLIGGNPVAAADSHALSAGAEIWMPIAVGDKVAIYGGKANIATAGG